MTCAWIGCGRRMDARQLCPKHYKETLRAGARAARSQGRMGDLLRAIYGRA